MVHVQPGEAKQHLSVLVFHTLASAFGMFSSVGVEGRADVLVSLWERDSRLSGIEGHESGNGGRWHISSRFDWQNT